METTLHDEAMDVLDSFLFEDVLNNQNFSENEWAITWVGNDYVLFHYATGKIFNFCVSIGPGTLTPEEIRQAGDDQEWFEDDE